MKYRIQVYIDDGDCLQGWYFIKGPTGEPYEYADREEAYRMAKMCYPNGGFRVSDLEGNPV